MKRYFSLMLAALLLIACFAVSACDGGSKKPAIPEGYQEYSNGAISFAYPADWKMTDSSVVDILDSENAVGVSIMVAQITSKTDYASITPEAFENEMANDTMQQNGMTMTNIVIEQTQNGCGTKLTKITYDMAMSGISFSMYQTMFVVRVGEEQYRITLTGPNKDSELAQVIFDTLYIVQE